MNRRRFLGHALGLGALPFAQYAFGNGFVQSATVGTGLGDLDRLTSRLAAGSLIVVASRPSMGKSLLALQIADHTARAERRAVTVACGHDDAVTVAERLVCIRTGIWRERILAHRGLEVGTAASAAATVPILLDDTSPTIPSVARRAIQFASKRCIPLGAIIVDDLDKLVIETMRVEHDPAASGPVAKQLRSLAREIGIPVIVTAQVNRAVEDRDDDYRPRITDFSQPYAPIVRASDVVITIYRDEIYQEESADVGLAELALVKHPSDRWGTVKVRLS